MTTSAIGKTPDSSGAAPATPLRTTTDTFLQLLVAQMRTQNPLEPQKGTEFVAQLAQFNTLEQLMAIRADLDAMRGAAGHNTKSTT